MTNYEQRIIDELFQEEANDPCEGCTTRSCEWGICSQANE